MSMPISRVEVQMAVVGRLRSFSRDSVCSRMSLDRLPWWGRNSFGTPPVSQRRLSRSL